MTSDNSRDALADERRPPKAARYPEWVPDDDERRLQYDVALSFAAEAYGEPPESRSVLMAAEPIYHDLTRQFG